MRVMKLKIEYCIECLFTPWPTYLSWIHQFPYFVFLDGSKWYMSLLNGCHIAWNVHSITVEDRNISCITIKFSKEQYSANTSSFYRLQLYQHGVDQFASIDSIGSFHQWMQLDLRIVKIKFFIVFIWLENQWIHIRSRTQDVIYGAWNIVLSYPSS